MFPFPQSLERLRVASMFPASPVDMSMQGDNSDQDTTPNIADVISSLYTPHHEAMDELIKHSTNMPERSSYEPGNLRKIGAFAAGLGQGAGPAGQAMGSMIGFRGNPAAAMDTTEHAAYAPFERAVEDWRQKYQPLNAAATREEQTNRNERLTAEQTANRIIQEKKANESTRHNKATEEDKANRTAILEGRAKTYAELARGGKIVIDKDGTSYINRKDGTVDKIDLKQFTPAELTEMKTNGHLKEIAARGAVQVGVTNTKGANDIERDMNKARITGGPTETSTTTEITDAAGKPAGTKVVKSVKGKNVIKSTITMTGPDNKDYEVAKDKVGDAIAKGMKVK